MTEFEKNMHYAQEKLVVWWQNGSKAWDNVSLASKDENKTACCPNNSTEHALDNTRYVPIKNVNKCEKIKRATRLMGPLPPLQ